jgi:hypothetical protein
LAPERSFLQLIFAPAEKSSRLRKKVRACGKKFAPAEKSSRLVNVGFGSASIGSKNNYVPKIEIFIVADSST